MNILYGVVGEGMGHAMRSRVIIQHLVDRGHDIEIMASGRAVEFLRRYFSGVKRIHGLHMIYEENRVRPLRTLWSNVLRGAVGVPQNIAAYFDLIFEFRPQAVISDFESWTYLYGKTHRLPTLSLDNMQIINRCRLPKAITQGHTREFRLTRAFIKGKLPFCDEYFITTFFRPPLRSKRTRLFPPILRPEILQTQPRPGSHLLVYSTGESNESWASALSRLGLECRIYGMKRDLKAEQLEGRLRYQPFSESKFIDDLASCRALLAGGGFTLMGEALYLKKPMLAVPMQRQFEQWLNARYLELEGYGRCVPRLESADDLQRFIEALPAYEAKLADYAQNGNEEIFCALDAWLEKVAQKRRRRD